MKNLTSILAITFLLTSIACKKERNKSVTVIKDCTGTYLRAEGKDYHVCNPEKVSSFSSGTNVVATFKRTEECNGSASEAIVCMMFHENEGWIDVIKIEQ
jgi:hypothetical protein